jgi:hypothetical protein
MPEYIEISKEAKKELRTLIERSQARSLVIEVQVRGTERLLQTINEIHGEAINLDLMRLAKEEELRAALFELIKTGIEVPPAPAEGGTEKASGEAAMGVAASELVAAAELIATAPEGPVAPAIAGVIKELKERGNAASLFPATKPPEVVQTKQTKERIAELAAASKLAHEQYEAAQVEELKNAQATKANGATHQSELHDETHVNGNGVALPMPPPSVGGFSRLADDLAEHEDDS